MTPARLFALTALVCAPTMASTISDPSNWPAPPPALPSDAELEARIETLLQSMSLEEKVGQVIQGEIGSTTPEDVAKYHLGSVLNGGGSVPGGDKRAPATAWVELADAYWQASTSGDGAAIPVLWGVDAVHGHNNVKGATLFPHNIALGAARAPDLAEEIGRITAREVAVTGLDWVFGPTVAVVRDDRWGRTYEGYSERPEVVAMLARAVIRGLQGRPGTADFLGADRVLATAKHFVGDGGTLDGRDQGDTRASEAELRDLHAPGYVAALGEGVQTVMASFSSWQGTKIHAHAGLLREVLKGRMGFDGLVVGDWNAHGQIPGCTNDDCPDALLAGIDMYMVPQDWKALWQALRAQVLDGTVPMERLDEAVRRILRVKARFGLFERTRPSERPLAGHVELLGSAQHRAVAREAVRRSLVLLKNEAGLLPLMPGLRVLVVGAADDIGRQSGGWTLTWQGTGNTNDDFPGATSIWEGIRAAVVATGGTAVLSPDGQAAGDFDVVIAVIGEEPYAEFQGDLDSLDYQVDDPRDLRLLDLVRGRAVPVVTVFISGRPLWINPELNRSDAFVAAWLPGSEGAGVADVLFRAADGQPVYDFVGRLPYSWPRTAQQIVNVGDQGYDPLFPFGYGLSIGANSSVAKLPETGGAPAGSRSRKVYFDGGIVAPWRIEHDEGIQVQVIDRKQQGDALSLVWERTASVSLRGENPIDLTREANGELALALEVRVGQGAASGARLAIGCGKGCSGEVDLGARLLGLPVGEWTQLRIRLSCFGKAGADLSRVDVPVRITGSPGLTLDLSSARLASAAEGPAPCP